MRFSLDRLDQTKVRQRTAEMVGERQNEVMNTSLNIAKKPHPAAYALHRQMLAVQRTMSAATVEQSMRASRWANAWYRLVQRKLDELQQAPRYLH